MPMETDVKTPHRSIHLGKLIHRRVFPSSTMATVAQMSPPRFLVRGKTVHADLDDGQMVVNDNRNVHKLNFSPRNVFTMPLITHGNVSLEHQWRETRHKTWSHMPPMGTGRDAAVANTLRDRSFVRPAKRNNQSFVSKSLDSNRAVPKSYSFIYETKHSGVKVLSKSTELPREITNMTVQLSKLQCYEWTPSKEISRTSSAPDVLYKNTYGLDGLPVRSGVAKPANPGGVGEGNDNRAAISSVITLPFISKQQLFERAKVMSKKPETMPTLNVKFNSLTGDNQKSQTDEDACLYSRLNVSMDPMSPDGQEKRAKRVKSRPLKREKGKYRPLSRTKVKTPVRDKKPAVAEKDPKSAENYQKYYLSKQRRTETRGHQTGAYVAPPNTNFDMYDRQTDSTSSESVSGDTTRALYSVVDCNRQLREDSFIEENFEVEEIPKWATENAQSPADSMFDVQDERNYLEVKLPNADKSAKSSPRVETA